MSTLEEIEAAAETLSLEQKQELLLFIAAKLRAAGVKPPIARSISGDHISQWIAQDEADMKRFREGK